MSKPTSYVLDASVLVARMRPSEITHADACLLLISLVARNAALAVPTIALAEIAAALSRGGGNPDQTLIIVRELQQMPGLSLVAVDLVLGELARDVAARHQVRGCDAVYVALAQMRGAVLITLDQQQRERSPDTVISFTPAQALARLQ